MLQAYEGYLEKGRFYPLGPPLSIQGRLRVIVTVLDEPALAQKETVQTQAANASNEAIPAIFEDDDDTQRRIAWLNRMEEAISASADEELPDIARQKMKPPHGLTD